MITKTINSYINGKLQIKCRISNLIVDWEPEPPADGSFIYSAIKGYNAGDMIEVTDLTGKYKFDFGEHGYDPGQFKYLSDVATDSAGNIYVADGMPYGYYNVTKFDSSGGFVTGWEVQDNTYDGADGITVSNTNHVYVLTRSWLVEKYTTGGEFLLRWGGTYGDGDGQFKLPQGICTDGAGNVYVADTDNHRIQKFSPEGMFLSKWGTFGSGDGQFDTPTGIAVDATGYSYVVDRNNRRIQKFDPSGTFVTKWGSFGTDEGQFRRPLKIAVDTIGHIYVADVTFRGIHKFTSSGEFVARWVINTPGTHDCVSVACYPHP